MFDTREALRMSDHEISPRPEQMMDLIDQPLSPLRIEVDHDVAAENRIERAA
jgi:hypothetical protein